MSDINIYRASPRVIRGYVRDCIYAGLVPFVQSSPGMGKSSIMRSIANEESLKLIDHRMSTSAPEDMSGLPRFDDKGFAKFAPFAELFPLEGMVIPEGYNGWMLFLDEWNSAKKDVQAASYKLILDKMVGQHNLHENVVICAAGNLATDRAIVNSLSTAMQSRVVHLEMEINHEEWLYDVALKENYDPRIIAYLSQYPSKLMDFRPDHAEKTFCCPRTWEFMDRLCKNKPVIADTDATLFAGTITSGVAVDFVQFTKVYHNLVKVVDILRDPENCHIPGDTNSRWAVITSMIEKLTDKTFGGMATYANRFDLSFRVLFFRMVMVSKPGLRQHPDFAKALIELQRYLVG